jgi:hypothetical protein
MADYAWRNNRHAILGTVYLYFAYGCHETKIPATAIRSFIAAHQDAAGSLTDASVRAAVHAVRKLDTGNGKFRASKDLVAIWNALLPLRPTLPA